MRLHRIAFLLLLTFLMVFAIPALAENCALCGAETGSDAYLCTNCLLSLLDGEETVSPITLAEPAVNADGTTTLTWEGGEGPYSVYYELLESAPVPFGWTAAEGLTESTCTLTQLVPGVSYIFTVQDSAGNKAECIYFAPKPGQDSEIGAKIRFKPMLRINGIRYKQTAYSAAEIMADNGQEHGLYLRLTYSMLKKTRNYAFCITVEAPNGFSDVIFSGTLELTYGCSAIPVWGFIPIDDYFSYLERYYGGVPTGEYLVTMHFNGNVVYGLPFTVEE